MVNTTMLATFARMVAVALPLVLAAVIGHVSVPENPCFAV